MTVRTVVYFAKSHDTDAKISRETTTPTSDQLLIWRRFKFSTGQNSCFITHTHSHAMLLVFRRTEIIYSYRILCNTKLIQQVNKDGVISLNEGEGSRSSADISHNATMQRFPFISGIVNVHGYEELN